MRRKALLLGALLAAVLVLAAGLGGIASGMTGAATGTTQQAYAPHINPSGFTTKIDNKYFLLKPGTTFVYQGNSGGNQEHHRAGCDERHPLNQADNGREVRGGR